MQVVWTVEGQSVHSTNHIQKLISFAKNQAFEKFIQSILEAVFLKVNHNAFRLIISCKNFFFDHVLICISKHTLTLLLNVAIGNLYELEELFLKEFKDFNQMCCEVH